MDIFSYLLPQDLILASQVCKKWHGLANDKYVSTSLLFISYWRKNLFKPVTYEYQLGTLNLCAQI